MNVLRPIYHGGGQQPLQRCVRITTLMVSISVCAVLVTAAPGPASGLSTSGSAATRQALVKLHIGAFLPTSALPTGATKCDANPQFWTSVCFQFNGAAVCENASQALANVVTVTRPPTRIWSLATPAAVLAEVFLPAIRSPVQALTELYQAIKSCASTNNSQGGNRRIALNEPVRGAIEWQVYGGIFQFDAIVPASNGLLLVNLNQFTAPGQPTITASMLTHFTLLALAAARG